MPHIAIYRVSELHSSFCKRRFPFQLAASGAVSLQVESGGAKSQESVYVVGNDLQWQDALASGPHKVEGQSIGPRSERCMD